MRNVFHRLRKVFGALEAAAQDTEDNTRYGSKQKDNGYNGLHDGSLKAGNVSRRVTQDRVFRPKSRKESDKHQNENEGRNVEGSVLLRRNDIDGIFRYVNIRIQGAGLTAPRFGNFFRYPPANGNNGHCRR